ncbi:4Fe-4S binding protein [Denitrobacterium detoxificans]|jgi:2-oxoacid:acceptor oxidoreductase delta subunit (pyruvate/2-ketoisovalerate family)|uniref:4Fe-4S binding protein n=1 Tax=Denitrobacterium detoxificans TaxID=79604 RepID=UPI0026ECA5B8|nr:4Fe-4S binding protein [Denitrobacterium detoxificans]
MGISSKQSGIVIPTLRQWECVPAQFDRSTCFEAGHLVERNAGWRQQRPVINANSCTSCLQCYMYCPDGAIRKTHAEEGSAQPSLFVDLDFCKGCGICVTVCRFEALAMVPEKGCDDER